MWPKVGDFDMSVSEKFMEQEVFSVLRMEEREDHLSTKESDE